MSPIEPPSALPATRAIPQLLEDATKAPIKVACIGSRELGDKELAFCTEIGATLALRGNGRLFVGSGNATGADQAYARGVNRIDPTLLVLYLPWDGYEQEAIVSGNRVRRPPYPPEFEVVAETLHGGWHKLRRGGRALHVRNMAILENASLCVAWPGTKQWGGGTGTGMKRAAELGIPVLNLRDEQTRQAFAEFLGIEPPRLSERPPQRRIPGI